jgi:hypothetical protein
VNGWVDGWMGGWVDGWMHEDKLFQGDLLENALSFS